MKRSLHCALTVAILVTGTVGSVAADEPVPVSSDELAVGTALPEFRARDEQGSFWNSADHIGKKVVVIYFYPGDFTSGCIKQAQAFRDNLAKLEELDVELIGVSGDSVETHKLFKESHGLKHTLLSDSDRHVSCVLGMSTERGAKVRARNLDGQAILDESGKSIILEREHTLPRWTVIIGRDGKVVSKRTQVNPATDADEVRKLVAELSK